LATFLSGGVVEFSRTEFDRKIERAGEKGKDSRRQPRQAVGPAVFAFVFVKPGGEMRVAG
jgi:hypothetical protein